MLKEGNPILWNWKPCHKENGPHLNLSRTVAAARVVIVITSVLFILWEQHELQRLGPSRPIIFTVRGKNAKESQELGIWWDLKVNNIKRLLHNATTATYLIWKLSLFYIHFEYMLVLIQYLNDWKRQSTIAIYIVWKGRLTDVATHSRIQNTLKMRSNNLMATSFQIHICHCW